MALTGNYRGITRRRTLRRLIVAISSAIEIKPVVLNAITEDHTVLRHVETIFSDVPSAMVP